MSTYCKFWFLRAVRRVEIIFLIENVKPGPPIYLIMGLGCLLWLLHGARAGYPHEAQRPHMLHVPNIFATCSAEVMLHGHVDSISHLRNVKSCSTRGLSPSIANLFWLDGFFSTKWWLYVHVGPSEWSGSHLIKGPLTYYIFTFFFPRLFVLTTVLLINFVLFPLPFFWIFIMFNAVEII